ncbi:N-acetyltransferase [Actinokineospora fastidiosa]|uniref:N-acetyltransferase n=2 Tax=Actinokineospora fastidiosa TaxID=1816 RepID=A0A918LID1_9PSEU|nr:N-acetyltransferase [Actinokineospora fastidiosa]
MRMEIRAYDHADSQALIAEVQQEYVVRYGGPDESPVDPAEFAPPLGLFLVGYEDGVPVATGGWRSHGTDAEIKRMYVTGKARGRGYARRMLAELEATALAAGHERLILETGSKQPEAVALYRSAGYVDIPAFGHYADAPLSIHLGKVIKADSPCPSASSTT